MALAFHHRRLPNQLDIIAESNEHSHSVAIGIFVATGSRDEITQINGVSHFLEHMMFKGSQKYTWEDVNRIFDELGARYNAFTTQEMTAYYANVLPEFTEQAIEHLSHLLRPALRQEDFDTEKKVILEEIAMYLDDPNHRVYERVMEEHFGAHPMGMSVLGSQQTVGDLKREQMVDYFNRRYGPGNMVISVAGRFDFEQIVKLVERYCGDWPTVTANRHQAAPAHHPHRKAVVDPKLNRQYTMGLLPGPTAQDECRYAARILADVIGDADGSRLYWALVDNAMAEEADFGFYPHDRCGSYYFSLVNDPARTEQVSDVLRRELARVKEDVKESEVVQARNKIASQLVLQSEVPMGRMRSIASQWLYTGSYRSLEEDMQRLMTVGTEDLTQLVEEYPLEPMTTVTLGPR
jgi:predicted Zn-dependent peptidase